VEDSYYRQYIKSALWREIRAEKLKMNPSCQKCGSTKRVNVHHKNYDSLGLEDLKRDLQTLCEYCHRSRHGLAVKSRFEPRYILRKKEIR